MLRCLVVGGVCAVVLDHPEPLVTHGALVGMVVRGVVFGVEVFSERVFGLEQLWVVRARELALGRVRLGVLAHRRPVPKRLAAVRARRWESHHGRSVLAKRVLTIGLT
jgi:hypothetical protein